MGNKGARSDIKIALRIATKVRDELPHLIQPSSHDYALVCLLEEIEAQQLKVQRIFDIAKKQRDEIRKLKYKLNMHRTHPEQASHNKL